MVERLSQTAQNELINIVTILLGLTVGSRLAADTFLSVETLGILAIGLVAFAVGTATGVLMGKAMHRLSGGQVNPLIGAAGVSAVPMAARVVNRVGLESNPNNHLLMHAMGPERGRRHRLRGGRRVPAVAAGVVVCAAERVRTPGGRVGRQAEAAAPPCVGFGATSSFPEAVRVAHQADHLPLVVGQHVLGRRVGRVGRVARIPVPAANWIAPASSVAIK